MDADTMVGGTEILSSGARLIAVATAEAALKASLDELMRPLFDDDDQGIQGRLVVDPKHPGTPAQRIDARAIDAATKQARRAVEEHRDHLGATIDDVVFAGEESGTQTRILEPGTLIIRIDPLDGTTNALMLLQAFSSVATVDYISHRGPRHLAGAILGGEFDVSWAHWSRRAPQSRQYVRPNGHVYVRTPRLGNHWHKLDAAQAQRNPMSVASVAASAKRFIAYKPFREWALEHEGVAYHLGGNPLCASLLLGHVGSIVETQNVSLHDSAYLLPHWLVYGKLESLAGEPVDYISQYEEHCDVLQADYKPISPFVAYSGERPSELFAHIAGLPSDPRL